MTGKKISELPILPSSQLDSVSDSIVMVDASAQQTKRMAIGDMIMGVVNPVIADNLSSIQQYIQNATADLTPPPTPTGFMAVGGVSNIDIQHDTPTYTQGHGHYETVVYGYRWVSGQTLPTFNDATEIARFSGRVYSYATNAAAGWRLWIKWKSKDGAISVEPAGGLNGLFIQTSDQIAGIIDALTGQLNESHLTQELNTRIDLIDGTGDGSVNSRIAQEALARNDALLIEGNARILGDSILNTAIISESNARELVDSVLSDGVNASQSASSIISDGLALTNKSLQNANNILSVALSAVSNDSLSNKSSIISETSARQDIDSLLLGGINLNKETSNALSTALVSTNTTINNVNSLLSSSLSSVAINSIANTSAILNESNARQLLDGVLTNAVAVAESANNALSDAVVSTNATLVDAKNTLSAAIAVLSNDSSDNKSALFSESTVRQTQTDSVANQINTAVSTFGTNTSAIVSEANTRATSHSVTANTVQNIVGTTQYGLAAVSQEAAVRSDATGTLASKTDQLVSNYGSNTAAINQQQKTFVDATSSLAATTNTLISATGDNAAALVQQQQTYTNLSESVTSSTSSLAAKFDNNSAAIVSEANTRATSDSVTANTVQNIAGASQYGLAAISQEALIRSDATGVLSSKTDQLVSSSGSNTAAINQQQKTFVDTTSSLASTTNTLSSATGDNAAAIVQQQQTYNNLSQTVANSTSSMSAKFDNNASAIVVESNARSSSDSVTANAIQTVVGASQYGLAAISGESAVRSDATGVLASKTDQLVSTSNSNASAINQQQKTFADSYGSLAATTTVLTSATDDNSAAIAQQQQTYTNLAESVTNSTTSLESKFGNSASAIVSEANTRATSDNVNANAIQTVAGATQYGLAAVSQEALIRSDATGTLASKTDQLVATSNNNTASINQQQQTFVDATSSLATATNTLRSATGDNTAAIVQQQQTYTNLSESVANSSAALNAKFDNNSSAIKNEQSARVTDTSAIASNVTDVVAKVGQSGSAISSLQNIVTAADSSTASSVESMKSAVGDNKTYITQEAYTRADETSVLSNQINRITADTANTNASIQAEASARADATSATTKQLEVVQSNTQNSNAAIVSEANTRATSDGVTANIVQGISGASQYGLAAISSEASIRSDATGTLASKTDQLSSSSGSNTAAISQQQNTFVDATSSLASTTNTLRSATGDNVAAIVSEANTRSTSDGITANTVQGIAGSSQYGLAAISQEAAIRSDATGVLASKTDQLSSSSGNNTTSITEQQKTLVNSYSSLAATTNTLSSATGDNAAALVQQQQTYSSLTETVANANTSLAAKFDNNSAAIVGESNARSTSDSSSANLISNLSAQTNNNVSGIKAEQSARTTDTSAIASNVTDVVAKVGQSGSAITSLQNVVASADASTATSVESMKSAVGDNKTYITQESYTRATETSVLSNQINRITADTVNTNASIQSEATVRADATSSAAQQINVLKGAAENSSSAITQEAAIRNSTDMAASALTSGLMSVVGSNVAAIQTESITRTTSDTAYAGQINIIGGAVDNSNSVIKSVSETTNTNYSAITTQTQNNASKIGDNLAAIDSERVTRVTTDSSLSSNISSLVSSFNGNAAAIQTESIARSEADNSVSALKTTISASNDSLSSSIIAESTARINADSTNANSILQVQSRLDTGDYAAVKVQASTSASAIDGLKAQYTVKVDTNGYVTGFGLASTTINSTPTSEFTIVADKFSIAPVASAGWNSGTVYAVNANVYYEGNTYNCIQAHTSTTSVNPTDTAYWQRSSSPFYYINQAQTIGGITIEPGLYVAKANIAKLSADQIDTRGLTITDANGNIVLNAGDGDFAVAWGDIGGNGKPADNATKNIISQGTLANRPTGADGDFYFATDTNIFYQKISGSWVQSANNYTNTNQLTDGANLGKTAEWPQVAGNGKPLDNAGKVLDTRDTNTSPADYAIGNIREFKTCSVVGLATNATYCVVETIKGWGDNSGGEATQWAFVTSGEVWKRSAGNGASTWGSWVRDLDRNLYTGDLAATKNIVGQGTLANRPTGADGDFYYASDTGAMYQKTAGAWVLSSTNTYIDSNGKIQGVSSGGGIEVSNSLIRVGGRNFLRYGGDFTQAIVDDGWDNNGSGVVSLDTTTKYGEKNTLKIVGLGGAQNPHIMRLKPNTEYTVSALVKGSSALTGGADAHLHIQSWVSEGDTNVHQETSIAYDQNITTDWKVVYQTFKTPASAEATYCRFFFYPLATNYTLNVAYVKLEEGNKATDWMPAIEDLNASISVAATTSNWSGVVNDGGKPENNATVGADASNLKIGVGSNLVANAAFSNGSSDGWTSSDYLISSTIGVNLGSDWTINGWNVAFIRQGNGNSTGYTEISCLNFAAKPSTRYEYYAFTGAHRCNVEVFIYWYGSNGASVGNTTLYGNDEQSSGGTSLSGYKQTGGFGTSPATAVAGRLVVRKNATKAGQSDSYAFITNCFVAEANAGQTAFSAWASGPDTVRALGYTGDLEANKTYVDGSGKIQGVSSGGGTAVANSNISISSSGALSGAGGGQVTISGLGYKIYRVVAQGNSATGVPTTPGLYIDGASEYGTYRSYMLVRIRRSDGVVTFKQNYDVYNDATKAQTLADDLNSTTSEYIVIVYTHDEPQNNRTAALLSAMYRCGASPVIFNSSNFKFRSAYALIGIPGCGTGNGAEFYQGSVDSDANAWIDASFSIVNGNLTGISATYTPNSISDYGFVGDLAANKTYVDSSGTIQGVSSGAGTVVNNALVDIGGTNLLKNSTKASFANILDGTPVISTESIELPDGSTGNALKVVFSAAGSIRIPNCLRANDVYSFSTYHKVSSGTSTITVDAADAPINSISSTTSWQWHKQEGFTVSNYTSAVYNFIDINVASAKTLYLWHPKVEFGNKATDWLPAVEDVDSGIATAATTSNWNGISYIPSNISTAGNNPTVSVLNNAISVDSGGAIQGIGTGTGQSVANNIDSVIRAPGGGVYITTTSAITGRLKITLPQSWSDTMMRFTVEIYEYSTDYMCTIEIGGYNYSANSTWYNVSARVIGGSTVEYPVYFGYDGTKCCIWIGATTTETWAYPQVRIRDFFAGYSNYQKSKWESGWVISFDQTAITTGSGTNQYSNSVVDTLPGANWAKIPNTNGRPENNATVGATSGVNLKDSSSNIVSDIGFLNKYSVPENKLASDLSGNPYMTIVDPVNDRPAGIKATYTTTKSTIRYAPDDSNISYSASSRSILSIYNSADSTIGACWPAFRVQLNQRYRIFLRWRTLNALTASDATPATSGLYFRIVNTRTSASDSTAELPYGYSHIGTSGESGVLNKTTVSECKVISDTNGVAVDSTYENKPVTANNTWYETVLEYTPYYSSATGYKDVWASFSALNYTGLGSNCDLQIDTCFIYAITTAADNATVGAPAGTYVGNTLAETVETNASDALSGLSTKLNKSGADIMTGSIRLSSEHAFWFGSSGVAGGNNGVYIGNTGIVGKKSGNVTFSVSTTGDATFGGTLEADVVKTKSLIAGAVSEAVVLDVSTPGSFYNWGELNSWVGAPDRNLKCAVNIGSEADIGSKAGVSVRLDMSIDFDRNGTGTDQVAMRIVKNSYKTPINCSLTTSSRINVFGPNGYIKYAYLTDPSVWYDCTIDGVFNNSLYTINAAVAISSTLYVAVCDNGVMLSSTNGIEWSSITHPTIFGSENLISIHKIDYTTTTNNIPTNAGSNYRLYIGSASGKIFEINNTTYQPSVIVDVADTSVPSLPTMYCAEFTTTTSRAVVSEPNQSLVLGTGNFTVEAFVYKTVNSGSQVIIDSRHSAATTSWVFYFSGSTLIWQNGGTQILSYAVPNGFPLNKFVHVAYSRKNGTGCLMIDGVLVASTLDSTNYNATRANMFIGSSYTTTSYFNIGKISNLMITVGTAKYDNSPFTYLTRANVITPTSNFIFGSTSNSASQAGTSLATISSATNVTGATSSELTNDFGRTKYSVYNGMTLPTDAQFTGFSSGLETLTYNTGGISLRYPKLFANFYSTQNQVPQVAVIDLGRKQYARLDMQTSAGVTVTSGTSYKNTGRDNYNYSGTAYHLFGFTNGDVYTLPIRYANSTTLNFTANLYFTKRTTAASGIQDVSMQYVGYDDGTTLSTIMYYHYIDNSFVPNLGRSVTGTSWAASALTLYPADANFILSSNDTEAVAGGWFDSSKLTIASNYYVASTYHNGNAVSATTSTPIYSLPCSEKIGDAKEQNFVIDNNGRNFSFTYVDKTPSYGTNEYYIQTRRIVDYPLYNSITLIATVLRR